MDLFSKDIKTRILKSTKEVIKNQIYDDYVDSLRSTLDELYRNIPDEKRISYGRYYTIKILSKYLYDLLIKEKISVCDFVTNVLESAADFRVRSLCLGIISHYGLVDKKRLEDIVPIFKQFATEDSWEARENAAAFFQKIIKAYPLEVKEYLTAFSTSKNPYIRRFSSETLRPVSENRWIHTNPSYSLSILQNMFKESIAYPRTSVGNNLSDLAKKNPELIFQIIQKLVDSGNKNSYWIAYRACRNLVKTEPIRVMDVLQINIYKYKKNEYRRTDYQ